MDIPYFRPSFVLPCADSDVDIFTTERYVIDTSKIVIATEKYFKPIFSYIMPRGDCQSKQIEISLGVDIQNELWGKSPFHNEEFLWKPASLNLAIVIGLVLIMARVSGERL